MKKAISLLFDFITKSISIPIWILLVVVIGAVSFHTFTVSDVKDDYIQQLSMKDNTIKGKDELINTLNNKISEKDGAIAVLNDAIQDQNDAIDKMHQEYIDQQNKDKIALAQANQRAIEAELKLKDVLNNGSLYSDDCEGGMQWLKDSAPSLSF
ncbi:hypothetical protein YerA41_164c [Yersinia phage YerA41]|nr:hypothetical protein YerA41_164c [Yersinia phage YerA41]